MTFTFPRPFAPPSSRRRGRRAAPAAEVLEIRALLAAGSAIWAASPDLSATTDDAFRDVAVQADGKIVAVGTINDGSGDNMLIARFNPNGSFDTTFGGGVGWRSVGNGGFASDVANAVAVQADGKIVVAGTLDAGSFIGIALLRLNADGSSDSGFGTGGVTYEPLFDAAWGSSVAIQADGRIVVGGQMYQGGFHGAVARFKSDGTLDGTFDGDGYQVVSGTSVGDVAVDSSGRILAATDAGGAFLTRLLSNGTPDPGFGTAGVKTVSVPSTSGATIRSVALATDGRIVVGGNLRNSASGYDSPYVVRLLGNGDYDTTFNIDGRRVLDITPDANDAFGDLALLPNGGVVVTGAAGGPAADAWLAVITSAGSLDARFNGTGTTTRDFGGSDSGNGVAVTRQGHYVVAGGSTVAGSDSQTLIGLFEGATPRRDDLLGWTSTGDWYAAPSTGSAFGTDPFGHWNPDAGWKIVATADVNGDGLADAVGRDSTGQWWFGRNTGRGLATVASAKWNEAAGWHDLRFADFNGDGKTDVAARTGTGQWWVSPGTGTGLAKGRLWAKWNEAAQWRDVLAADFNGDGRADLAGRTNGGQWYVGLSTTAAFALALWDSWVPGAGWQDVMSGDFDGDGRQDIAGRTSGGQWWVAKSDGHAFTKSAWGTWTTGTTWSDITAGDFNRDGESDIAGRASNGQWYFAFGAGTAFSTLAGSFWNPGAGWHDVRFGDFDGDGRTDIAGRTTTGEWFVSTRPGGVNTTARWGKWNENAGWTTFEEEFVPTV